MSWLFLGKLLGPPFDEDGLELEPPEEEASDELELFLLRDTATPAATPMMMATRARTDPITWERI